MKHLRTDQDTRVLMPGYHGGFHVVLFWSSADPQAQTTLDRFTQLEWGMLEHVSALEVEAHPAIARWFGISTPPAVVVVYDGMMLCVEHGCQPGACERLERWALHQYTQLLDR
ncbi:MAG: hypothetical protein AAFS10_02245 [Myxococcota bacterium]